MKNNFDLKSSKNTEKSLFDIIDLPVQDSLEEDKIDPNNTFVCNSQLLIPEMFENNLADFMKSNPIDNYTLNENIDISAEALADDNGDSSRNIRKQDRFLPVNNVSKIMKESIPVVAKISHDAKSTMQECASEFISFVCSEALELCANEKRRILSGDDLIKALKILGFDDYVKHAEIYIRRIREASRIGYLPRSPSKGEE